ncbi:MAG: TonB-dependent receptor [Bacteroidota bacterium]|nr:TonB-dependent receptor [Bacteroidota bacterium]
MTFSVSSRHVTNAIRSFFLFAFFVFTQHAFAQTTDLTGRVTDSTGNPLSGATVRLKGTNRTTKTNEQGSFTLNAAPQSGTLVISFVGYEQQELGYSNGQVGGITLAEASGKIQEVIVTAENRAVSVQRVPIAIDLVQGRDLRKLGVVDITQLPALAPGLQFEENTIFSSFTVRGVGSHEGAAELSDQAITVSIDGEYINRPVALGASMFDVDRVEVLKGPQGTLYGRNATAGAINVIAKKPTNRLEGDVFAQYGNYKTRRLEAALNIPVSDMLSFRAAGMLNKHKGYRDAGPAGRVDDGDVLAGRLGLLFKPIRNFSIYLVGEANRVDQTAPAQYGVGVTSAVADSGKAPSSFRPAYFPKDFPLPSAGFVKSNQWALRGRAQYNLGSTVITYTGGYRDVDFKGYQPLNGFIPETFSFDNQLTYQTQSHEFRINGENSNVIWQAGVFYGHEDQSVGRGLFLPAVRNANPRFNGQPPYLNFFLQEVTSKTTGVFAQSTYNFNEKWSLTGGLRYSSDKKERDGAQLASAPFAPNSVVFTYPNRPTTFTQSGMTKIKDSIRSGSWDQVTWMVNLEHHFAPNKLLFGKVSTGYKAGGFDLVSIYKPEKITAFEIGSKNTFANNRLKLNLSAFAYNYKDQQVSVFLSTAVGSIIRNAGKTRVYGLESETEWAATREDRFKLVINYLDAKFKDLQTSQNLFRANPGPVNLAGNRPVQSPKWTVLGRYDRNITLNAGSLSFGIQSMFKSEYFLTPFNWAADKQEAFTKTDANLTFTPKGDWFDIGVYVQNLEDNRILNYASFNGSNINIYNWIFGNPRTYGVQFNYRFRGK